MRSFIEDKNDLRDFIGTILQDILENFVVYPIDLQF